MDALTTMRFLAAIWVVLFHYGRVFLAQTPAFALEVAKVGYVGVSFFFLLSGYVLAYTYLPRVEGGTFRAREFWWARVARVYPLYLLVFAASLPAAFFQQPLEVFVRLALLQSWLPDHLGGWNLPAWSLSAEAFFYAVFPLAILGASRVGARWLLPLATAFALFALVPSVAFILLRPAGLHTAVDHFTLETTILKVNPLLRLPNFLAGVMLGAGYLRLDLRHRLIARPWVRRGLFIAGLSLLALLLASRRHLPWELTHNGLYLVPFGLLIVALSPGSGTIASLLSYRLPVFLGEISYAVYIVHVPLHEWIEARFFSDIFSRNNDTFFLVYLAVLFPLAALLHFFVERPARRWLRSHKGALGVVRTGIVTLLLLLLIAILA